MPFISSGQGIYLLRHSSRLSLRDSHGSDATAGTDYRCTLALQILDWHALVVLLLGWWEATLLLLLVWVEVTILLIRLVCKRWLSKRRAAHVAVLVLRWLLGLLRMLLTLLVVALLRVTVVVWCSSYITLVSDTIQMHVR